MILDYLKRIFTGSAAEFTGLADKALLGGEKLFIVTANPEILMNAEHRPEVRELLLSPDATIVPDGISVVKAMHTCGLPSRERITGVELAEHLLATAGKNACSVYLLGAKEEVVSQLADKLNRDYPQMTLHYHNGYDGDKEQIFEEIKGLSPDLVIVALGAPAQELLISRHYGDFQKGVFIGVGGSFDVLSGSKRRAPDFFIRTNTEWLYRIAREPSRLGRFWNNNVKFLGQVRRAAGAAGKKQG